MARSNGRDRKPLDPQREFERIRRKVRSIYGRGSPALVPDTHGAPKIDVHEDEESFLLFTRPLAQRFGEIELVVDWNEVEIVLPSDADPTGSRLSQRIGLPAVIDPDRTEMIYSGGALLLRLAKRLPTRTMTPGHSGVH